jgi:hypothetical protein
MFDYVDDLLRDHKKAAPEEHGTKTSAAPRDFFVVDDDCEKLDKKKAEQFHHLVANALFTTKRARLDTGTAVSFLSTRVRGTDKQDWRELVHLMKCLQGTGRLPLILSSDGMRILKWWVNGSFAVHPT